MKKITLTIIAILIALFSMISGAYAQLDDVDVNITSVKMDVLYVGVSNPVSINIAGMSFDSFTAEISSGAIFRKSGSDWIVNVKAPGIVTISCISKDDNKVLLTKKFRVKNIPTPKAYLSVGDNLITSGNISKSMLSNARIVAKIDDFDFDVKFQIVGFNLLTYVKGFAQNAESRSSNLTATQAQIVQQVSFGSIVVVENIKAKGPDGKNYNLGSLCFNVR